MDNFRPKNIRNNKLDEISLSEDEMENVRWQFKKILWKNIVYIDKDYNINEQFDENTLDYTASVPYEVENLEINATAADENAKVEIKGNNNLKVGEKILIPIFN